MGELGYQEHRNWNSSLRRKSSLRDSYAKKVRDQKSVKTYKPAFKKGKKTKEWDADRARLKVNFRRAGITICEIGYPGCTTDNFLGFCHSKKRRNIVTKDDREEVILGCQNCHDTIEAKSHTEMHAIVNSIIQARETPVRSIFD